MTAGGEADHRLLEELVAGLTRSAASAPAAGEPREGAAAAVAGVDRPGHHRATALAGSTALCAEDGSVLPEGSPEVTSVEAGTLFDMASVTKVVTALTAATLIEDGMLDPETPVAEYLPLRIRRSRCDTCSRTRRACLRSCRCGRSTGIATHALPQ